MKFITVPRTPPSPNELRRRWRHPLAYRRLRKQWEHDLFYGIDSTRHRQELIAEAAANQRMEVQITIYYAHHPLDPDNLPACQKPVLDALKNLGFIVDDSEKKLKLLPPEQIKVQSLGQRKTVIKIGPEVLQ